MNSSGLYIHVPFCKSKCHYCDFYSVTTLQKKQSLLEAIAFEIRQEASFLYEANPGLRTIYFGGGTPSLLEEADFRLLFNAIESSYDLTDLQEVTLEANPDDLTPDYIQRLRSLPFNRISIGVQSLNDDELNAINRRHSADQAIQAVMGCKAAGFNNISIDLMYGLPGQTLESFCDTIELALSLPLTHVSSYALSWEEGSVLYHQLQHGVLKQASDEFLEACYHELNSLLLCYGFNRYELSNFSLPGYESKHNSSYWEGLSYLGVGPGAHSYNGMERRVNVPSIDQYIEGIRQDVPVRESELLDLNTRYNDFIMTRLRTTRGVLVREIERLFGISKRYYCLYNARKSLKNGLLIYENDRLRLDDKGLFIADSICSDLIWA